MKRSRIRPFYYFLFAVNCLIWGTTWWVIKVGLKSGVPSFRGAAFRFLLTAAILFVIILFRKTGLPRSFSEWRAPLFLGVFYFFIPYSLIYWSENHIPSALAAVIYGTMPLLVMIVCHFMFKSEKMTLLKGFSALTGIAGVVVISLERGFEEIDEYFWGVMAMVAAAIVTSYCTAYTKKHVNKLDIFVFLGIQMLLGGVLLLILSLAVERPFTFEMELTGLLSILYLALVGAALGWTLWIFLISRLSVVLVSYVQFFIPLVAIAVGVTLGKEKLSSTIFVGAVMIFASILLVIQAMKADRREDAEPADQIPRT